MRRALSLALLLLVIASTPVLAQVGVDPSVERTTAISDVTDDAHHGERPSGDGDSEDDGRDGTDAAAFVALFVAGLALMAAVAALVFARVRQPA